VIRPIRILGDPVLRTPSDPVTRFDEELRALVDDLLDTIDEDPDGRAGLAAPQIGVGVRVFAYDVPQGRGYLVNPEIELSGEMITEDEGCLSLPGLWFPTARYSRAVVTGADLAGEPVRLTGNGHLARVFQHETDHLAGKVYVDRLTGEVRKEALRAIRAARWS
jgi:peptide deformylase